MAKRHCLIDGDVVLYKAAAAAEKAIEWSPGYWTWHCDWQVVENLIHQQIEEALELTVSDECSLALTDSDRNYRLDILPSYKGNRKATKKPLMLMEARRWLLEDSGYEAYLRPRLEGDDVLGILATWPKFKKGMEKVIYSVDKDLRTIPGLYYRRAEDGLELVDQYTANEFWLAQTLAGDPTDGYTGCPGIGMARAMEALKAGVKKVPYEHTLLRGKRAGQVETRYRDEPEDDLWEIVVSLYKAAGLNETVALQQARCARILRAEDYDFKNKVPILWTPA